MPDKRDSRDTFLDWMRDRQESDGFNFVETQNPTIMTICIQGKTEMVAIVFLDIHKKIVTIIKNNDLLPSRVIADWKIESGYENVNFANLGHDLIQSLEFLIEDFKNPD